MLNSQQNTKANKRSNNSVFTRRSFLGAASSAALSALLLPASAVASRESVEAAGINSGLFPSMDEVWDSLEAMNRLSPRFTGNEGHCKFVDMLESGMRDAGLQTLRDTYTFPRWEARKWSLFAKPKNGQTTEIPVTFYYPHSGQTGPLGVAGPLVYVGKVASDGSSAAAFSGNLKGKIALVDYELVPRDYHQWYQPWGFYVEGTDLDKYISSTIAVEMGLLTRYRKAGAAGVVISWANLSDGQATGQNMPFGRPLQDIPGLLVGHDAGDKLKQLAAEGATATLTLDARIFPNSGTDSLVATLPGSSPDEVLIITTHTDGPNAVQENGGIALLALAKYFAKLPRSARRRTLVFSLTTGHDNGAYVPGSRGFIERHPEIISKAIASVSVEHLGCREWRDDETHVRYLATGKDELTYAISYHEQLARLELESATGTSERRVAAVRPKPAGRYLGVGGVLANTGMPTLGCYASPTYLNIVTPDGCLSKLTKSHMHGQLVTLARLFHKLDDIPASSIKWRPPSMSGRQL